MTPVTPHFLILGNTLYFKHIIIFQMLGKAIPAKPDHPTQTTFCNSFLEMNNIIIWLTVFSEKQNRMKRKNKKRFFFIPTKTIKTRSNQDQPKLTSTISR